MNVILILIPVSLAFAGAFLLAFIWSVRNGQFEDTDTPAMRILAEEERNERR
jgi:cbb3-type cytochrome oxidase maturation protein